MIVDYWMLRRTRLTSRELYRYGAGGEYWFYERLQLARARWRWRSA